MMFLRPIQTRNRPARHILCVAAALAVMCGAVLAPQGQAYGLGKDSLSSNLPIEVTADKELEWDRAGQTYIARGSAKATQGGNSLEGDVLKAFYDSDKSSGGAVASGGNVDIKRIEAYGHVVIKSDGNTAIGDKAVYNLVTGEAVLTGGNLMLTTAQETITARDRITFNSLTNIMTAEGAAKIEQGRDTLESDKFVAYFEERNGERVLKEMEALGNVVITTPDEVLTGDRGKYVAATNTATVYGNVKIVRGENVLTGDRGQFNMTTRKSKLFGGSNGGVSVNQDGEKKRVKAIFYPE